MDLSEGDERILSETANRLNHSKDVVQSCVFFHEVLLEDFPAEVFLQRPAVLEAIFSILSTDSALGRRRWDESQGSTTQRQLASTTQRQQAAVQCLAALCKKVRSRQLQCLDASAFVSPSGLSQTLDISEPMVEVVTLSQLVVPCLLPWTTSASTVVASTMGLQVILEMLQPDTRHVPTPLRECCSNVVHQGLQLLAQRGGIATDSERVDLADSVSTSLLEVVCYAYDLVTNPSIVNLEPDATEKTLFAGNEAQVAVPVLQRLVQDATLRFYRPSVHSVCLTMLRDASASAAEEADGALLAVASMEAGLRLIAGMDSGDSSPSAAADFLRGVWEALPGISAIMPTCFEKFMAGFLAAAGRIDERDQEAVFLAREQLLCLLSSSSTSVRDTAYRQLLQARMATGHENSPLSLVTSGVDYVHHLLVWGMAEPLQLRGIAARLLAFSMRQGELPSEETLAATRAIAGLAFAFLEEPEVGHTIRRLLGLVIVQAGIPAFESGAIMMRCLFHRDPRIRVWGFAHLVDRYGPQLQGAGADAMVLPERAVQSMMRDAATAALLTHRPQQAKELHNILLNEELEFRIQAAAAQQLALVTHSDEHCAALAKEGLHIDILKILHGLTMPLFVADASEFVAYWSSDQCKACAAHMSILRHLLQRVPTLRQTVLESPDYDVFKMAVAACMLGKQNADVRLHVRPMRPG